MKILTNEYREILKNNDYVTVAIERALPKEDEKRAKVREAVERLLAGKLNGHFRQIRVRHINFEENRIVEVMKAERKPGSRRKHYTRKTTQLEMRHVHTAKLYERHRHTRDEYDEQGSKFEPFVSVLFVNGDRVEIPFESPPRSRRAAASR